MPCLNVYALHLATLVAGSIQSRDLVNKKINMSRTRLQLQSHMVRCNNMIPPEYQLVGNQLARTLSEERRVWSGHFRLSDDILSRRVGNNALSTSTGHNLGYDIVHGKETYNFMDTPSFGVDADAISITTQSDASEISHTSSIARHSRFVEGSMSKASEALASTWSITSSISLRSRDSEADTSSSRSSIDLTEFSPSLTNNHKLKQTFQKTIKRLQKPVNNKCVVSTQSDTIRAKPKDSQDRHRGGLRKSISTWKVLRPSTADATKCDIVPDNAEAAIENRNIVASKAGKFYSKLDTLRPRRSFVSADVNQNHAIDRNLAVLNERKRQADIAYAEQFGTVKQVQTRSQTLASQDVGSYPSENHITVKKKSGRTSNAFTTVKRVLNKSDDKESTTKRTSLSNTFMSEVTTALLDPAAIIENDVTPKANQYPKPAIAVEPVRKHDMLRSSSTQQSISSTSMGLNSGHDIDTLKQRSVSQLEKENRHLREILKQKEMAEKRRIAQSTGTKKRKVTDNCSVHENEQMEDDCTTATNNKPIDDESGMKALVPAGNARDSRASAEPSKSTIPVIVSRKNYAADTDTCKRRRIEAPRALSMVLEGIEFNDENDGERPVTAPAPAAWKWDDDVF